MEQTVYKVVDRKILRGDTYLSALAIHFCFYAIGEKTIPKTGGVFVFSSLKDAEDFCITYGLKKNILEGIGSNVRKIKQACKTSNTKDVIHFWKLKKQHKSTKHMSSPAPKNSYICDWFIPIKKIC